MTLRAPYEGSRKQIIAALATREPTPAFQVRPGLPLDAQAILDHGLARKPGSRYQSAKDLQADLDALLAYQPVSVRPTTSFTRAIRRIRRSKMVLGAALVLVALAILSGVRSWRAKVVNERGRRFDTALAHLPANLGIVSPANRRILDDDLRAGVAGTLDELVNSNHEVVVSRTLRGLFRWDQGDYTDALQDLFLVHAALDTPFAGEIIDRYKQAVESPEGSRTLDLADLPEPADGDSSYFAAFHMLRAGKLAESERLLSHEELDENRHALELRLVFDAVRITRLHRSGVCPELFLACGELVEDVRRLERESGFVSATTAHLRGLAHLRGQEWEEALASCRTGLELAPASHVILQNAGLAATHLFRDEEARGFLLSAIQMQPGYAPLHKTLALAEAGLGNAEAARELVDTAIYADSAGGRLQRHLLQARVELNCAQTLLERDPEASKACLQLALKALAETPEDLQIASDLRRYAKALASSDKHGLFVALVDDLDGSLLSRDRLDAAIGYFPDSLGRDAEDAPHRWLERVAADQAARQTAAAAASNNLGDNDR